jgi:hypothetical protein
MTLMAIGQGSEKVCALAAAASTLHNYPLSCARCSAVLQGVVDKVIGKYTAEVCMLDSGDVLRIDQAHPAGAC